MTAAATSLPSTSSTPHNFEVAPNPNGPQNQKRPLGLNLTTSMTHAFPHYPLSAPSSTAPVRNAPPSQSPAPPIQRNASFSFAPTMIPNNYPAPPHPLGSAPPSASIPLPHASMSAIAQVPLSQNSARARLPLLLPNSVPATVRTDTQPASASPSSQPANLVRPSSSSATSGPSMPNGKVATSDGSVVPPPSLSNFPGLGFAVQSTPTPHTKPTHPIAASGLIQPTWDAGRFFNTYIYDYLLKQGLLDVARAFVTSGAEFDLVDPRESNVGPHSSPKFNNNHSSGVHKRRRSEASIINSNGSPHGTSNMFHDGQNPPIPKGSTVACELLPSERSMSSSSSTVSNTSRYGFNQADSNRSSNETPNSQAPHNDSTANSAAINGANGTATCAHASPSPRSSPPNSLPSLDNLPKPKLALDTEMGFLFEWWSIFWDVFRAKTGRAPAQSKPAQLYAQTVASLGATTEPNGMSKARREALGVVAVPNPADLQKGQLNDRIHQSYALLNSTPYDAIQQDSTSATGSRLSAQQLQAAKNAMIAEQAARQQQLNRLQQQHFQRVDVSLARQRQQQAQAQHQQQQQQAQMQQQQQQQQQQQHHQHHHHQELQQRNPELRPSQQVHQIHPGHHEQFIQQRQLPMNVRRVGMMASIGSEQSQAMMPPPAVQHNSPLNPHPQGYRSSPPPSRSSALHVSSPFAPNQAQPPRQPSRASNHANSPALQPHPRTPSASHASTPQPSVPPSHIRASPAVNNGEQERKKRRLHEPVYGSNDPLTIDPSGVPQPAQPLHQLTHQQQIMMAQQQQLVHHHLQQMNYQQLSPQHQHQQHPNQQNIQQLPNMSPMQPPRRSMNTNSDIASSPTNTPPSNINAEAYKQSMHAKHNQTLSPVGASGPQKAPNVSSPTKEAVSKLNETSMPPPSSRNVATQPSTPQSSAGVNKTTDSTPMPTTVAPSPNIKPMRPASQNDNKQMHGVPATANAPGTDSDLVALPSNQLPPGKPATNSMESKSNNATVDSQAVNLSGDGLVVADHQDDKSLFASEADPKPKSDNLWSLDSNNAVSSHQDMKRGVSSNISPTAAQNTHSLTSDALAPGNTNPMDQLFTGDPMFDLDTCLFEAFINYDHSNPDLPNAEFS